MAEQIGEIKRLELWGDQLVYYRTHLDVFIEDYFKIPLKDIQKVVAREIGLASNCDLVQSRGFGKTWLVAICSVALCVLYPGTLVAVLSGTSEQAGLTLKKIETYFAKYPDVAREIKFTTAGRVLSSQRGKLKCEFKNGSEIESYTMSSFRGNRAKIVIIDEAPLVKQDDIESIVNPAKNYRRPVCQIYKLQDYDSKSISITSACLKSNPFFEMFTATHRRMNNGSNDHFAVALDYNAAVNAGITDMKFFMEEKSKMHQSAFDMEYGSLFVGAEANSVFPYDLTETCRVLTSIEVHQPKESKTSYVMGVDLATSGKKNADNAVITVIKLVERNDGSYLKKLVFIRSYHGRRLDYLATEVRKMLVRFPNTIKVVFDHHGLGDSFPQFLSQPWIDPMSGKEYPPLVCDDETSIIDNARPLLRPVRANAGVNQTMVSGVRVALEQRTIELPISSKAVYNGHVVEDVEDDSPDEAKTKATRKYSAEEMAVFLDADALQIEMGNIVMMVSSSSNYLYDTAKPSQHKDRYSSLGMAVMYCVELETARKLELLKGKSGAVIGSIGFI